MSMSTPKDRRRMKYPRERPRELSRARAVYRSVRALRSGALDSVRSCELTGFIASLPVLRMRIFERRLGPQHMPFALPGQRKVGRASEPVALELSFKN